MALPLLALLTQLPDHAVRHVPLRTGNSFEVRACASLKDLWCAARRMPGSVAVVDGQRIGGLWVKSTATISLMQRVGPIILDLQGAPRQTCPRMMSVSAQCSIDQYAMASCSRSRPQRGPDGSSGLAAPHA